MDSHVDVEVQGDDGATHHVDGRAWGLPRECECMGRGMSGSLVSLVVIPALRLVGELREAPALSEQYCATSRGIVWNA